MRRQLALLLLPPIGGWLLLKAATSQALGPAAAMALLVILTVVPMAVLILRDGRMLNALEAERRMKAQLQAAMQRNLEGRLSAQAADLALASGERAKAEAALYRSHKMEAVGQLTGGIAHDFNNLLTAVGGNLQLLARRLGPDHPSRKYVVNATTAVDRGVKLTSQLLAFSRTQKLQARPVQLDGVLATACDLIGNALGPSIEVHVALGAADGWALTDPDQLELAILNLALNARDAMPGGGTLTVTSGPCVTAIDAGMDPQEYLSVKVFDTGTGMDAEVADKAIEPFFTTKERGKGTGLGLAQVYGFVRQCGGDLRIDSEIGRGTTIELLFRRAHPAAVIVGAPEQGGQDSDPAWLQAGGRSLLVIDDDDSVRAVIVETLRDAGYRVTEASNGKAGLELLMRLKPSAAIIDFIMPGMNGAEVARRAQHLMPGLPVIFVSGYFDTAALDGIVGALVLRKPIDLKGLQRLVLSVIH